MRGALKTIRGRLIVLLIALVLIPVLVGFSLYNTIAGRVIERQLAGAAAAVLDQTVLNVDRLLGTLTSAVNILAASTDVQRHLARSPRSESDSQSFLGVRDLQQTMELVAVVTFQHAVEIFLMSENALVSTVLDNPRAFGVFEQSEWYRRSIDRPGRMHWTLETFNYLTEEGSRETTLVTAARTVRSYDGSRVAGVAAVSVPFRSVARLLEPEMRLVAEDEDDTLSRRNADESVTLVGELENGWRLHYTIDRVELLGDLIVVQRVGLMLAVATAFLVSAVILVNVVSATRSLKKLEHRIEAVQDGDLSIRMPALGDDEIGTVAQQINTMLDQIQQLFADVRREHELAETARMARLQSQIHPHFLMNALNTVNWAARMSGADNVARLVSSLSSMLERTLYHRSPFARLSEEIGATREFLTIEEYRSEREWHVELTTDSVEGDPWCPIFTIQPLVENAIKHGMPDEERLLHIAVRAETNGSLLRIVVEDDGVGCVQDDIAVDADSAGIGLANLNDRVHAHFGPEFGVHVDPDRPRGCRVIVELPNLPERP